MSFWYPLDFMRIAYLAPLSSCERDLKPKVCPPLCERIDGCKSGVQSAGQTVSFNVGINNQISKNEENLNFFSHMPLTSA